MLIGKNWCCQTGLNCRPLHYQWSALPLSYGSMPGIRGIGPKGPCRRPVLATRAPPAQARGGAGKGPKRAKIDMVAGSLLQTGPTRADRFHFASRAGTPAPPNHCGASGKEAIARRADETQYVRRQEKCRDGTPDRPRMQDDQDERAGTAKPVVKDSRQARLKLALRENLKRRKSQARGRSDDAGAPSENTDASLDDAGGVKPGQ